MALIACDVSYFQPKVDDTYPHPWLIFRLCDGDYLDPNADHNATWAAAAVSAGKMQGWTAYVVYRPDKNNDIVNHAKRLPAGGHVMIDVESWQGAITGNHSDEINQLVSALSARPVWAYGNRGDLASIYPNRGSIPVVVASYGGSKPDVPNMIGWQYTDGQYDVEGKPSASAPFGKCDHNELYITAGESTASNGAKPITGTPSTPSEEEEMPILIFAIEQPTLVAISWPDGQVQQTTNPGTVNHLRAAGAKTVAVAKVDWQRRVAGGRK